MPVNLNELVPAFQDRVQALLANCRNRGISMQPNEGLRDPYKQARYWRQSRTSRQVTDMLARLEREGALFLAHCLRSVGPQNGAHVTGSIPGLSWHQWGEALDCYWVVNGKAEWSLTRTIDGQNGYLVYAAEAKKLGLEAGLYWKDLVDAPHVQLRKTSNPGRLYSLRQIDEEMERVFEKPRPA